MTAFTLNRLTPFQLARLAYSTATFLTTVARPACKIELYYLEGYFIELSYRLTDQTENDSQWELHAANHYPDLPASTTWLTIYMHPIKLLIN
ncbi:hypothetical protein [Spirosoma koreense]